MGWGRYLIISKEHEHYGIKYHGTWVLVNDIK